MSNQVDIAHGLNAHHADEPTVLQVTPELNAGARLGTELRRRHVGLVPTVRRDDAAVSLSRSIDDAQDERRLILAALAQHAGHLSRAAGRRVHTHSAASW
jgi:hypothetical protein